MTWRDLYAAVAAAVGVDLQAVPSIRSDDALRIERTLSKKERVNRILSYRLARFTREMLPNVLADALKRQLKPLPPSNANKSALANGDARFMPFVDSEMPHLQLCRYMLPIDKTRQLLGYEPQVIFSEGCRRTEKWLRFVLGMDGKRL